MDASTSALNEVAQHSLTRVSSELMVYIASGATRTIDKHMQVSLQDSDRLRTIVTDEIATLNKSDGSFINHVSARLWSLAKSLRDGSPGTIFYIAAGEYGVAMMGKQFRTSVPTVNLTDRIGTIQLKPSGSIYAATHPLTGLPITDDPTRPTMDFRAGTGDFDLTKLARSSLLLEGESVFPLVTPLSSFIGYALSSRLPDATGSVTQLETAVFVQLSHIQELLSEVANSAGRANGTGVMRAFSTIASTWYASRLQLAGQPIPPGVNQTGVLTGVSHGETTEYYWGLESLLGVEMYVSRVRQATNATDPYIKAVAIAISNTFSYSGFYKHPRVIDVLVNGTVLETHIVSCDRLTYPQHGLDWWITVSIDAESVLGDVQRESAAVGMEIEEDKQRVADDIASQKVISRSIIAGIAVGLVVLSAVTSFIILRPIKALQQKMELVAGMQLDNMETESTSTFYELRHMQRDFRKMVRNLLEFRAYVPSSVLESNGYSGEGGCQVVEPPTGKVAIVFTDIKGSTNLWKLSPGDMNVAMEVHNEVIREACVEHSGYEVKTIGDSFMVSFSCPVEAARFALDVQTKLAKRVWPSGLELPPAGLVVRIGANYGQTIAEENPVTGRVDYRGGTVNLASRVEGKARPGTVCITSDMCAAIRSDMDKLGDPVLASHGVHDIKGLGGGHELFTLVSQQQRNRLIDAETDTEMTRAPQSPLAGSMSDTKSIGSGRLRSESNASSKRVDNVPTKRTALQLQRTNATVAVCRLVHDGRDSVLFDNCNIMVRSALEAAHATDGVIGNVTGRTLTVVWNASKKCAMHSTAALNFVSEMKKLQGIMQVGLATGTMLHGNVGTKTSRFATAFGTPLEAAEAMTDHASMFGVYCLYADCTVDKRLQADVTVRSCLRLVDAWKEEGKDRVLHIYEVHLRNLAQAMQGWGGPDPEKSRLDTDLDMQTRAVEAALQDPEGADALRSIVEEEGDEVLLRVLRMFDVTRPRDGYRCTVRFSKVPGGAVWQPRVQSAF
eukprot:TRINITY_DN1089_c0_g1_i4.p1 TRINITY_DN1089_c0_g1~~TRINITY_DN1089_c0_g1_i4.p1  ORF type:complete len:1115 (+),score=368.31 TRINITY_DN1089_c0_g1_i4:313-3345(+)